MISISLSPVKTYKKLGKFDSVLIKTSKYSVRLAKNRNELELAQQLRFEVFNLELGEGLESSYLSFLDADEYDEQCYHLLVIENEANKVIGTYRIQDSQSAEQGIGFYTANEFDINQFPKEVLDNGVELGRACIQKEHRNGRVLFLLWKGIAEFLKISEKRYLFGCCSLSSQDPVLAWSVYNYLNRNHLIHKEYMISTKTEFQCPGRTIINNPDVQLPNLFELYLKIGAKVCSSPAIDRSFKTIDYLILLDLNGLNPETKNLFFR
jgi:putative hemolysin